MLETKHGVGTFVRTFNLNPVLETLTFSLLFDQNGLYKMTQIRESMEVGLIREVVAKISEEDLDELERLCQETRESGWTGEYDQPFHHQIYACLSNELIGQVLDIYWMACKAVIDETSFTDADRFDNWRDHYQIYLALRARDPAEAIDAMRKHFIRAKARMRSDPNDSESMVPDC